MGLILAIFGFMMSGERNAFANSEPEYKQNRDNLLSITYEQDGGEGTTDVNELEGGGDEETMEAGEE